MSAPTQWAFASAEDAEQWHGPCKTREEAIASAYDYYGSDEAVYVSTCRPVDESDKHDEDIDEDWTFIVTGTPERVPAIKEATP